MIKMGVKKKYQLINSDSTRTKCKKAVLERSGWLHYELDDGTVGLKRPGTFEQVPHDVNIVTGQILFTDGNITEYKIRQNKL